MWNFFSWAVAGVSHRLTCLHLKNDDCRTGYQEMRKQNNFLLNLKYKTIILVHQTARERLKE